MAYDAEHFFMYLFAATVGKMFHLLIGSFFLTMSFEVFKKVY